MLPQSTPRRLVAAAVAGGLLALSGPEAAEASNASARTIATEPAPDSEALSASAVEAFEAGRFDDAVSLFEQAYDADPQPNYLFNIGRVYEEKGDLQSAVDYYTRFIGESGVDIDARKNAAARLKVLKEAIAALEDPKEEPEPEPEPTQDPEPPEVVASSPESDEPTDKQKKLRIAGYSLIGVGGAALIVGGVFGGLALGKTRSADDEPFVDEAARLRRDARSQARVADAMYITGGILAGAGLVMVLTTLGKKKTPRTAAARHRIAPAVGRNHVGVSLGGRF